MFRFSLSYYDHFKHSCFSNTKLLENTQAIWNSRNLRKRLSS